MPLHWMAWISLALCGLFSAKLLTVLVWWPENASAAASLMLAAGFAALTAWLFRLRRMEPAWDGAASAPVVPRAVPTAAPVAEPGPPSRPAPVLARPERRRHPRVAVDWEVEMTWPHAGRQFTRLHDLSRGGARLVHRAPEPVGRRGLLLVPGLKLPVPFTVVESAAATGLHIRFDLGGMGLDELEQQLDGLVARGGAPAASLR